MPFTIANTADRAEFIAECVTRLLARGGQQTVTMRAISRETGLSQSSLAHHLGSRARLMSLSSHLSGRAHIARLDNRVAERGLAGLVAHDADDLAAERAWLAWTDLARVEDLLSLHVHEAEELEALPVRRVLVAQGREGGPEDTTLVVMAMRGLRAAVCRRESPMPAAEAVRLLELLVSRLPAASGASGEGSGDAGGDREPGAAPGD